ncbi:MAG: PKD domain-containing protein [Bacteroidota bacterium]
MIKRAILSLAIFLTIASGNQAFASHVPGGNITYECIGPNQYEITLTLFEDCGTAFEANGTQFININNDCGFTTLTSATLNNVIYQQEVSQLCPSQMGQSECSGGTLPGVWMHQWTGIVTLPGNCDSWTFSYTSCCRNNAVNSTTFDSYYWESVLNSTTAPCNTSAQITSQPIPYVCINQPVNWNMAAIDPDGNTLQFSLINAANGPGTSITYVAPYTGSQPITGISINPTTGQITFTPTVLGNFIVAVLVEEFDANGNLVGSVIQDFQIEVINCTNQVPSNPAAGISNFSGSGTMVGNNTIQACEGDSFCFDLVFSDSDASNVLTVTSNAAQIFPGATVTITGTNPVTATFCTTIQPGSPTQSIISFDVLDDACPISGINSFPVQVNVITSTYAGPDEIMCLGQGVQLTGSGGSNFNWTVISGPPMNVPTNFSCNNCQSPIANPASTTTYQVVSNLSGGCTNVDTVTVNVVPDFTYTITQTSGTSCLQDPVQVNITTNPGGAYTFAWTPGNSILAPANSANPTITATAPGNYTFYVDITSPNGCVKSDSVTLNVAASYSPNVTASASIDSLTCGDFTQLDVSLGGGIPATCGPSLSGGCSGPVSTITMGTQTGSNTNTTYPAPYGNWYANEKHQFLFTAAELQGMGFIGGKISEIGWEIITAGGITTYPGYTISMGCTNQTNLTTTFITGLTTVYGPTNTTVAAGWNMHTLATPYEWDGVSNLVVEICYTWTAQYTYTTNAITPWTTTAFTSSVWFNSDGTAACPQLSGFGSSTNRPITRFTTCPSDPDPANYTYSWTPSASVTSPNSQTTPAQPFQPTYYTVLVTDINGGCSDTSGVFVYSACPTCYTPIPTGNDVSCNGSADGDITATMVGTTGPWTVNWYDAGGNLIQTTANVTTTDFLSGLVAGTYTIEIIDTSGCMKDTTYTINEPPVLTVNAGVDQSICYGSSTIYTAVAAGGTAPYSYLWSSGAMTSSFSIVPTTSTCYIIGVADANNCTASDTVCVTVNPAPVPSFTVDNTNGCYPVDVNFTSTTTGTVSTLTWDFGDGNTGTGTNPFHSYTAPGCYNVTLTATSPNGCVSDTTYPNLVCPYPYPVANFLFGPQPTNLFNTNINFQNQSSSDAITWNWNFAGMGTSTQVNPSFEFPNDTNGVYNVTLLVSNQYGCLDSIMYSVIIDGIFTLYVPNAFTPDGDGKNDIFMPFSEGFDAERFEFFIFNRWGEVIFKSTAPSTGWDGTFKGMAVKQDVYVWKVKAKDSYTKEEIEKYGHVTLIR